MNVDAQRITNKTGKKHKIFKIKHFQRNVKHHLGAFININPGITHIGNAAYYELWPFKEFLKAVFSTDPELSTQNPMWILKRAHYSYRFNRNTSADNILLRLQRAITCPDQLLPYSESCSSQHRNDNDSFPVRFSIWHTGDSLTNRWGSDVHEQELVMPTVSPPRLIFFWTSELCMWFK